MKWCSVDGFTRVSKRVAAKRYAVGDTIYMCPCNLRPGDPWHPEVAVKREINSGDAAMMFEHDVTRFEFYNCGPTAGKYAAYYIRGVCG